MRLKIVALSAALVLLWGSSAHAHDPIILTAEQSTPANGPLLPDGTVSFALYGTLDSPSDTRGFRVNFQEGDALYFSLLIPDLAPENQLATEDLPRLEVVDPSGVATQVDPSIRDIFEEPFSGTNYVRLADLAGVAVAGTYEVTITGSAPARFTVSVGTKELFGTEVENVPNRDLGVAGVMSWYETPPPTVVATITTMVTTTVATTAEVPTTDDSQSSKPDEVDNSSGGSSGTVIAVVVVAAVVAIVASRRRKR